MNKFIKYLFNKGYFPRDHKREAGEKILKGVYLDPKHEEFRKTLMHDICKFMAEDLEMKGSITPLQEAYFRILSLFTPKEEYDRHQYIDPVKAIEKQINESLKFAKE